MGYDAELRTLEIEFISGGVYRYYDVPAEVHQWLMNARSKGTFVTRLVRGKYDFERVWGDSASRHGADDLLDALQRSQELDKGHTENDGE